MTKKRLWEFRARQNPPKKRLWEFRARQNPPEKRLWEFRAGQNPVLTLALSPCGMINKKGIWEEFSDFYLGSFTSIFRLLTAILKYFTTWNGLAVVNSQDYEIHYCL